MLATRQLKCPQTIEHHPEAFGSDNPGATRETRRPNIENIRHYTYSIPSFFLWGYLFRIIRGYFDPYPE